MASQRGRRPKAYSQAERLARMLRVLSSRSMTLKDLTDEFSISRRQVYRELDRIQEEGHPLEQSDGEGEKTWQLPLGYKGLPPITVSSYELMALHFAKRHLDYLAGTPYADDLDSLIKKIEAGLPHKVFNHLARINQVFLPRYGPVRDYAGQKTILKSLQKALLLQCTVVILHRKPDYDEPVEHRVYPYLLLLHQFGLYLVGYSHRAKQLRMFAVERIVSVKVLEDRFSLPEGIKLDQVYDNLFGLIDEPAQMVRIQFTQDVAYLVKERCWHPSQKVECLKDGSGIVTFTAGGRRAHDRELFDEEVTHNGKRIDPQPPLPYGGDPQHVFKLSDLLGAWRKEGRHSSEEGLAALRSIAGDGPRQESLSCLHKAFERVRSAEVALLCVDPKNFHNENKDFPQLFDRIGAGGTPLVGDERLYSIYKYHWPHIRDAVNSIYDQAGHVLSPAKIAATATRIAYAQTSKDRNDIPDVGTFSRMMLDGQSEDFKALLRGLIPPSDWEQNQQVTLLSSFKTVKSLLARGDGVGHFWLPDVMLASLPAELWQVLLFWAVRHPTLETVMQSREEVVRFALFWYLCVFNNEKAARWAFTDIKKFAENVDFPGKALYRLFIGIGADHCAHELIPPKVFEQKLCKEEGSSSSWRSDADRFVVNGKRDHLLSDWWYGGRKMLPWLQRDYIQRSFPQYVPLAEHEDDLPYDVDHLCPFKDWGDDWRNLKKRLDGLDQILENNVYDCKGVVGNGIGNLRLVESSQNRIDQDIEVADKMPFILGNDQPLQEGYAKAMAESAFTPDHREVWKMVARPGQGVADRKWDTERLNAFQRAVEQRAAWLYERFHDDLGYGQWTNGT